MKKLFKLSDVLVNYKNLITTLVTNFGVLGVNVLTGILIARFLGPEGRGEQSAILLWPQFLAYLMTLGLPAATLYYVRFDPESSSLYTKVSLTLGLFLGLLSTLIGIIIMPLLLKSYSDEIVYFARCFMLLSPISLLSVILNSLMQSKEQYEVYNWFRFLPSIVTLLGLLILVALKNFNPVTTSLILAFAQIPVFIYGIFWVLRNFELDIKINMSKGKDLLNYALRAYPVDLLRTLGDQLDRVVVVGLLTPTLMGYYVVALSLSRVLNAVQTAMITVLIPDLIQQEERVIRRKTLRALLMSTSITGLVAVPLFFLGPWLIKTFYGSNFSEASLPFQILLFEAVLTGMSWVLAQPFLAINQPGKVTMTQTISFGLGIPLLFILAKSNQLVGVAFSLLIISIVRLLATYILFDIRFRIHLRKQNA